MYVWLEIGYTPNYSFLIGNSGVHYFRPIWRFPKSRGQPQNIQSLDHFGIETHSFSMEMSGIISGIYIRIDWNRMGKSMGLQGYDHS